MLPCSDLHAYGGECVQYIECLTSAMCVGVRVLLKCVLYQSTAMCNAPACRKERAPTPPTIKQLRCGLTALGNSSNRSLSNLSTGSCFSSSDSIVDIIIVYAFIRLWNTVTSVYSL
jgi:hypothetical protein